MARKGDQEKVSAREAAHRLGMTEQGVGQWANQAPPGTYEMAKGKRLLLWPQFPVWYRQHLQANREKPADFEAARARKTAAEAEIAEYELHVLRNSRHEDGECLAVFGKQLDGIRSHWLTVPGKWAHRFVGLRSLVEAQRVLDELVRDVLKRVSGGDSDQT